MDIRNKFQQILNVQQNNQGKIPGTLNKPINQAEILAIEKLLGETINKEVLQLYQFANGQSDDAHGLFFGDKFITSDEIIGQLAISRSLVKPINKSIEDVALSNSLLKKIVAFLIGKVPNRRLLVFKRTWFKMEFKLGLNSCSGPYLYRNENTGASEREILKINTEDLDSILKIVTHLHEAEKNTYNWDELVFVVYADGTFEVERTFYDFDTQINFTSTPENAIRKKYFHFKWFPLFSDYGGNFIGVDFDPETQGKKGQIINFGRDEENMFVLADDLEQFFDFILIESSRPGNKLVDLNFHLHDTLIELKR